MKRRLIPVALALILPIPLLLTACATRGPSVYRPVLPPPLPVPPVGETTRYVASWYGSDFHGRRTSSGEIYDMYAMTAAHKALPFGTRMRVTYLKTGRSTDITVTDRGPFIEGRDLDLSYGAAKAIGMDIDGVGQVEVLFLGRDMKYEKYIDERTVFASAAAPGVPYTIQFGAFVDRENAVRLKRGLELTREGAYLTEALVDGKRFHRVRLGKYPSRDEALSAARTFASEGYTVQIFPVTAATN